MTWAVGGGGDREKQRFGVAITVGDILPEIVRVLAIIRDETRKVIKPDHFELSKPIKELRNCVEDGVGQPCDHGSRAGYAIMVAMSRLFVISGANYDIFAVRREIMKHQWSIFLVCRLIYGR